MGSEYTDEDAIRELKQFFEEIDSFAKMFAATSNPWNLSEFKKEVASVWYPQFKEAFKEGKVDPTWGANLNHAFVKWCWHNMVKFKEGIINARNSP